MASIPFSMAQTTTPTPSEAAPRQWNALWISHPTAPLREPLVLHFRKTITLPAKPEHFIVHASGDRRFLLYANGTRIGTGPAASDLAHWRYETFDLAPALHAGENQLSATVWNFGVYAALAHISDRTAFLVQGHTEKESSADTNFTWSVAIEPGTTPIPRSDDGRHEYMAMSPGESLDASKYGWQWQTSAQDTALAWVPAASAMREGFADNGRAAVEKEQSNIPWRLVPDPLPPMTYTETPAGAVVRSDLEPARTSGFPDRALTIPAHTSTEILLDRKSLTTAYPELLFASGRGSHVRLTYSEALYNEHLKKGNRDEVGQRRAIGLSDEIAPDGGADRRFEPLWWRTWRYLSIHVTTGEEPLTLKRLTAHESRYPFVARAEFASDDPQLARIWEIGWRTARLDAHGTYMDTPYYEQLQYVGDTRIQALISYIVTGDDRLARQAITAFANSRIPEGLTQSRYPSSIQQVIPPFSLYWIGMLHDLYWYRPDHEIIREHLQGTRDVLAWFAQYQGQDALVHEPPYWNFVDWVPEGEHIPSFGANGESCVLSLELTGALGEAATLERAVGDAAVAQQYDNRIAALRKRILDRCWSPKRQLLADTPINGGSEPSFSEHANILGVLYDVIPQQQQTAVLGRVLAGSDRLIPASYYFRFYLARALEHAGMADAYVGSLGPWRSLLSLNFSTWPEQPGDTRSDSHAWSAHPTADLITLVAGIRPASPGTPRSGLSRNSDRSTRPPRGRRIRWATSSCTTAALAPLRRTACMQRSPCRPACRAPSCGRASRVRSGRERRQSISQRPPNDRNLPLEVRCGV